MYHIELRQFPHNTCRFNLTDAQLRAIVEPWARGQVVELGERKWNPELARITILEGPQLGLEQLKMGRGWRAAERHGEDVTERALAATGGGSPRDSFTLGAEMAALLGRDPMGLLEAWRTTAENSPGLAPSESLALAEQAMRADGRQQS